MKKEFLTVSNASEGVGAGQIVISGTLSMWMDSAAQFSQAADSLIAQGATSIDVVLSNCYGGNVFEGAKICSIMDKCAVPVNTKSEGLCASMAAIIFAKGKSRLADAMGTHITHRASMAAEGCYETFSNTSTNLKKINDGLAQVLADATGMSVEDVHSQLMPFGKDVYHTADECIANGLATGKWESGIKAVIPLAVLAKSEMKAVAEFYDKQLENFNTTQTPQMDKKIIALAIGASVDADDATITAAVSQLVADKNKLQEKVTALETEKKETAAKAAKDFIDAAVVDGKVSAEEKASFEKLAQSDFDSVKAIINTRTGRATAQARLNSKGGEVVDANSQKPDESDADYYSRLYSAKGGDKVLAKIEAEDPAKFKKLKDAYRASL